MEDRLHAYTEIHTQKTENEQLLKSTLHIVRTDNIIIFYLIISSSYEAHYQTNYKASPPVLPQLQCCMELEKANR